MTEEIKVGDWVEDRRYNGRLKMKVTGYNPYTEYWTGYAGSTNIQIPKEYICKLSFSELPPEAWDELRVEKDLDEITHISQESGLYDTDKLTEDERSLTHPFEIVCEEYLGNYSGKPSTRQHGGNHYKKYPIQPYEYCFVNKLNNLQSEAISYITRYKDKGGKQDLEKAIHTLELLIEAEYDDG